MKRNSSSSTLVRRKALVDALAGVVASVVALWTFYPVDVWKTHLQAHGNGPSSISWASLFRGLELKTLHSTSSSFTYFYVYSTIHSWYTARRGTSNKKLSPATHLMLSAVAAMLNTFITLPLDVVASKKQTQVEEERKEEEKMEQVWKGLEDPEFHDAEQEHPEEDLGGFAEEKKEDSITDLSFSPAMPSRKSYAAASLEPKRLDESSSARDWKRFWKGIGPSLLLCSNPSIHYTVFDMVKFRVLQRRHSSNPNLSMVDAFFVGLFAKFIATISTYPLIRAKVMLMVTSQKSALGCLLQEYQEHGIKGWYKGCGTQLVHTVLKTALNMMVRERILTMTHRMLVPSATE